MATTAGGLSLLDKVVRKLKDPPSQDSDEGHVLDWAQSLHREGMARRRHWEGMWWENIAFYMGDFWVEWDIHRRRLVEPVRKADHRVRMPINLVQPVVRTELAKLTKNRPIMDVLARSSDTEDLNSAKVGDRMLNNYAERRFKMPRVRRRMLEWVLMCGMGGILVDWDKTRMGEIEVFHTQDGTPVFDPKLIEQYKAQYEQEGVTPNYKKVPMGEILIRDVSPFQVMWDFSVTHMDDAAWVIYTETFDLDEVYRRWKVTVAPDDHALPGVIENRLMTRYDLTGKLRERPPQVQKLAEIHQMWIKPGHPRFPNGMHLVFNKDVVLLWEEYPFGHCELPISMMNHIGFPVSQYSMSIVQQLKAPVLELSKTKSQLVENRNLMSNPPWLIPKQLQISKELQNRPGLRIEYNYIPNMPEPKPVEMPNMPEYVTKMTEELKEDIREISGLGETSQGQVPPGARSGVAIAYLQEEDDTRLGPTVAEFEETMENVAFQMLKIFAEKYDTPRTVNIYKNHSDPEVFDFIGTMLGGAMGVDCQAGSALPRSKAAKQQYILDLWDRKLEQDPRKVREMLEMGSGEPDEWEVDLDQAERENHEIKEGEDPGVQEWYNHPAHHYIHRNYMKSADFKQQHEDIRKLFERHDEEHTEAELRQQQEMAANQAAAAGPGGAPPGGGGAPGGEAAPGSSSVPAGANGQRVPQGPPAQFSSGVSPRTLMQGGAE